MTPERIAEIEAIIPVFCMEPGYYPYAKQMHDALREALETIKEFNKLNSAGDA